MDKAETVPETINRVIEQICRDYCKYPEKAYSECEDPDAADDYLYSHLCNDCPLNRLA